MTVPLLILVAIATPLAAYIGYLSGYQRGMDDGLRAGGETMVNVLIKTLAEQQYFSGANVLYLLRRMKGEKV